MPFLFFSLYYFTIELISIGFKVATLASLRSGRMTMAAVQHQMERKRSTNSIEESPRRQKKTERVNSSFALYPFLIMLFIMSSDKEAGHLKSNPRGGFPPISNGCLLCFIRCSWYFESKWQKALPLLLAYWRPSAPSAIIAPFFACQLYFGRTCIT